MPQRRRTQHSNAMRCAALVLVAAAMLVAVEPLALKRRGVEPTIAAVQLQTPAAAEHSVSEAFSRRQAVRSRPYSEGKRT